MIRRKKAVEDGMFMKLKVQREQELRVKSEYGNVNLEDLLKL